MRKMGRLIKITILFTGICFFTIPHLKAQTWMDHFNEALTAIGKGDYESAIVSYEKALPGVKKAFGEDHEYYSLCLNQLAQLYEFVGRYDRAEQLFLEAIALSRKKLGPQHPDYAKIISQLGEFYRNINQNERAEELFLEAAAIYK